MARSSKEWWAQVRQDPERLVGWLVRQYHAELRAARGMSEIAARYAIDDATRRVVELIAGQERQHAAAILSLLRARGVEPPAQVTESRYWHEALPGVGSFETGAGAIAHAEAMSLERFEAIISDSGCPGDIWDAFLQIQADERFHEQAFREMAGPAGMEATAGAHAAGRRALGLDP